MEETTEAQHALKPQQYVDVLLPVPIPRLFTYFVPEALIEQVKVGCRVIISFGRQKIQTGIIGKIHDQKPEKYEAKPILEVMDEDAIIHDIQLKLYRWIANYYMCTIGEVINVAIPSGLKLSSESYIQLNPELDFEDHLEQFSDTEFELLNLLKQEDQLTYQQISNLLNRKTVYELVRNLNKKGAILIFEQIKEKYKPRKERYVRLKKELLDDRPAFEALFEKLESKPKQLEVMLQYLKLVPAMEDPSQNEHGIKKSKLLNYPISNSSLKTLTNNGVFEEWEKIISRIPKGSASKTSADLSPEQAHALDQIKTSFDTHDITLLQGVTGSGKTEIYIKLIEEVLANGQQVLYLLPEIALTTQIVERLQLVFGDQIGVYHSKYSDNERVEVWLGLLRGNYKLIVGVRSSVFLPFDNLGLVIVDEEYESSFKQYEPAPRYHGRDVAIMLAHFCHAKTLLGTATPSFESYMNALDKKYGYVQLNHRYRNIQLPAITLIDLKEQRKKKLVKQEFSQTLLEAMEETLARDEQVIVFQNRRGYAPLVTCQHCGFIPKCHQCAVSLTYHQYGQEMRCHYCGYKEPVPTECEACGSNQIKTLGFGTERLEETLSLLFPKYIVQRMDLDTTRSKYGYQKILEAFKNNQVQILVGTQMVSKGLDFERVGLVAVIDADRMIHYPDFRSHEKAFQLIMQVSGRAGRRDKQGQVVVQTYDPKQELLKMILTHDFEKYYHYEIKDRQKFHYPPFFRLIKVVFKHKDAATARNGAHQYAQAITPEIGKHRVLGPEEPVINRIRNQYLMEVIIKLEKTNINLSQAKKILQVHAQLLTTEKSLSGLGIYFDVDPI